MLLVEKYRPRTFDDYVFCSNEQKQKFLSFVENQDIPNLLLSGTPGTGKTTAARILIDLLQVDEMDLLEINASDENNVDTIREKIISFVSTYAVGKYKVVHLAEADYLGIQAQGILRVVLEDGYENARFILTCNYDNKLIPAIKSRCQHFHLKNPDRDGILERILNVMISEEIEFDPDDVDRLISIAYPDIRKMIALVQQNTVDKVFKLHDASGSGDTTIKNQIIDFIKSKKFTEARKYICDNVSTDQFEDLYRFMYQNVNLLTQDQYKTDCCVVIIAKYLYQHQSVADVEINFAACMIEISRVINE